MAGLDGDGVSEGLEFSSNDRCYVWSRDLVEPHLATRLTPITTSAA